MNPSRQGLKATPKRCLYFICMNSAPMMTTLPQAVLPRPLNPGSSDLHHPTCARRVVWPLRVPEPTRTPRARVTQSSSVVASGPAVISFPSPCRLSGATPSAGRVTSGPRLPGRRFGLARYALFPKQVSKRRSLLAPAVSLPALGDPGVAAPPAAYHDPRRECPPPPTPPPPPGTREPEREAHAPTVTITLLIG